jgi:ornithine cyclodeaminase/alanine dehydrogenase-like protein (mu-crystallin family)
MEVESSQGWNNLSRDVEENSWMLPRTASSTSTDLFETVLRIHPEPLEYYDERRVHEMLTRDPGSYLDYLIRQLRGIAEGRIHLEMPPKQIFSAPHDDGDFRIMPCVVRDDAGIRKTVKIVGTNLRQSVVPDQITVGKSFVIHPDENFISHVFEACLLSSARTGACAALAASLLSTSLHRLTFIGAGRVSYYGAFYLASIGQVDQITFHDTDPNRATHAAQQLARQFPDIQCRGCSRDELGESDLLVLATTSTRPVYGPGDSPASLVISLGADTDSQRELDPGWARKGKFYVDTLDTARYGDLRAWIREGSIGLEDLTDLMTLLRQPELSKSAQPRFFVSTGTALFDNLTMGYMLECENTIRATDEAESVRKHSPRGS